VQERLVLHFPPRLRLGLYDTCVVPQGGRRERAAVLLSATRSLLIYSQTGHARTESVPQNLSQTERSAVAVPGARVFAGVLISAERRMTVDPLQETGHPDLGRSSGRGRQPRLRLRRAAWAGVRLARRRGTSGRRRRSA
jgi:hypothetical protein